MAQVERKSRRRDAKLCIPRNSVDLPDAFDKRLNSAPQPSSFLHLHPNPNSSHPSMTSSPQLPLPLHQSPSLPPYIPRQRFSPLVTAFSSQTTQALLADACLSLSFYIHTSLTFLGPTSSDLATLCAYLTPSSVTFPEHVIAFCEAQRTATSPFLTILGDLPLPFLLLLLLKEFLAFLYLSAESDNDFEREKDGSRKLFEFVVASVALHVGIGVALFLPRSFALSVSKLVGEMVLHEWSWAVAAVVGTGLVCWRVVEKVGESRRERWEVVEEKGAW